MTSRPLVKSEPQPRTHATAPDVHFRCPITKRNFCAIHWPSECLPSFVMHLSNALAAGTETRGGVPRRHVSANAGVSYTDRMTMPLLRHFSSSCTALLLAPLGRDGRNAKASRHVRRGGRVHAREGPLLLPLPRYAVSGTRWTRRISIVGCCCIAGKGCSPSSAHPCLAR